MALVLLAACSDDAPGAAESETSEESGSQTGDGDGDPAGDGDGDTAGDGDGDTAGDGDGDTSGDGDGDTAGDGDGDTSGDGDGDPEPDPRLVALETYAPRVFLPLDEEYEPSSAEFVFPFHARVPDGQGRYWLETLEGLDSPSDTQPFFAGDVDAAPVYAYWADKGGGIVDLVYWFHYPYQRGKEIANTIWGSHVGDWEHITVRLEGDPEQGYAPTQIYLAAHAFGFAYNWGEEVALHEGTHPIIYEAWGSHGSWAQPGSHVYDTIGEEFLGVCITLVCVDLVDETSAGTAWDTWENVVGFDFFAQEGLGGAQWPVWMSDDYTAPGEGDPAVPGQGPIYRWGNHEDCSVLGIPIDITDMIGVCRLEDGPTGPIDKNTWGPELN